MSKPDTASTRKAASNTKQSKSNIEEVLDHRKATQKNAKDTCSSSGNVRQEIAPLIPHTPPPAKGGDYEVEDFSDIHVDNSSILGFPEAKSNDKSSAVQAKSNNKSTKEPAARFDNHQFINTPNNDPRKIRASCLEAISLAINYIGNQYYNLSSPT